MPSEPFVSIIVPIYNMEHYLNKCLKTIMLQKFKNFELILIDDGSKDQSLDICNHYGKKFENIIICTQYNEGVSAARNRGLEMAKGAYVLFVDPDDYIESGMLDFLYDLARNNNYPDVIYFNSYLLGSNFKRPQYLSEHFSDKIIRKCDALESTVMWVGYKGYVWNKLYKRKIIFNIRFNTDIYFLEDELFNIDVIKVANRILTTSKSLYTYRIRNDSMSRQKIDAKALTYFDALQLLKDELPVEFNEILESRYKKALLDFSSKAIYKDRLLYHKLKKHFQEDDFNMKKYPDTGYFENKILNVAPFNYFMATNLVLINKYLHRTGIVGTYMRKFKN